MIKKLPDNVLSNVNTEEESVDQNKKNGTDFESFIVKKFD